MVAPMVFMAEPMLSESASNQPASESGDELLLRAEEHEVGEVGGLVVFGVDANRSGGDEGLELCVDGKDRPAGPGVSGFEHGGADDLDLEIGAGGEEDFAPNGEAVDGGDAFDGVAGDGIGHAEAHQNDGGFV